MVGHDNTFCMQGLSTKSQASTDWNKDLKFELSLGNSQL